MIASSVAAAPMVWPIARLDRVDRHGRRAPPEHASEHRALDRVVERGAGAVCADEVDLRPRRRRLRRAQRAPPPRARGPRDAGAETWLPSLMLAWPRTCRTAARPGIAPAAAAARGPPPRPSRSPLRAPIEGPHAVAREGAQHVEAAHHEPAEDVVAAGHDRIGLAVAQEIGADPDGGPARGAGGRHGEHGPRRAEPAGEVLGRGIVERLAQSRGGRSPSSARSPSSTPPSAVPTTTATRRGSRPSGRAPACAHSSSAADTSSRVARQSGTPSSLDPRQLLDLAAAADAEIIDPEALDRDEMPQRRSRAPTRRIRDPGRPRCIRPRRPRLPAQLAPRADRPARAPEKESWSGGRRAAGPGSPRREVQSGTAITPGSSSPHRRVWRFRSRSRTPSWPGTRRCPPCRR